VAFSKLAYLKDLRGHNMPSTAYRVLVAVFNYTDASGQGAHPGQRRLAEDTGIKERRVRDHLRWLTEHGYLIEVSRGHGSGGHGVATVYALNLPAESRTPHDEPTGKIQQATGNISSTNRQYFVDQPAEICLLSDPLPDPVSDHEHAESLRQQQELLDWYRKNPPSPGNVA
jgi:Helix-turn-helix domain